MNLSRYNAIIWLEPGFRGDRAHCAVAVGLRRECGDTSGMEQVDLTVRTDEPYPGRRQIAIAEADWVLAKARRRRTGDWESNGYTLSAPAKRG
jgi:hypothetical protein